MRTLYDSDDLQVLVEERSADDLLVVFVSAGHMALGGTTKEFSSSAGDAVASRMFVVDRRCRWYNYRETADMLSAVRAYCSAYARVSLVGESMGGCGALLAKAELHREVRTLVMSPQFSIMPPFINFDHRYERVSLNIEECFYADFGFAGNHEHCVVIYGNLDWRDYLHSQMFDAHGYKPLYLDNFSHNVAGTLKNVPGNRLKLLLAYLMDWSRPFDRAGVADLLSDLVGSTRIRSDATFAAEATASNPALTARLDQRYLQETGDILGANLALHKRANQSSTSRFSRGSTKEEDASRALTGWMTGQYSFHTGLDEPAWWLVDLGCDCEVQEIRVFNWVAEPEVMRRSSDLAIAFSHDGTEWMTVHERTAALPFGGVDGHPMVWRPGHARQTRFVRLTLGKPGHLHLDQVQVFGHEVRPMPASD